MINACHLSPHVLLSGVFSPYGIVELIYTRCYQLVKPLGHGDIRPTICACEKTPTVTVFFVCQKNLLLWREWLIDISLVS